MSDATNSNKRDLWLYDDGSWREGFHDDGKVSPLLHYIATPADDAVARAREAVIAAAKAQRAAAVEAFHARGATRSHLEAVWDGTTNVTQDAVARLLAAERDAKGGERG